MKKVLFLGLLVGLTGCKEKETGLEKQVINTAYDNCQKNLKKLLKSPSSMRVVDVISASYMPETKDVYRVYADDILDNETNKISEVGKRIKTRYRELGVSIDYEAQNSFGVYLPGNFSCSYFYELNIDDVSPKDIRLIKIKGFEEAQNMNGSLLSVEDASNIRLSGDISKVIGDVGSEFSKKDNIIFDQLEQLRSQEIKDLSREDNRKHDYDLVDSAAKAANDAARDAAAAAEAASKI